MAANCARRMLRVSSGSAKTLISRSKTTASPFASKAAKLSGLGPANPTSVSRISSQRPIFSRLPAELGGALSLMPLHSVTASALFTSLLSLNNVNWGCLSEGFATPL
ncbi:uncharacterized protein LOC119991964 [Tripterygium wilfordii]|uniref:uncharacterized protein LOC119991964 n=1 Tax=Tripterygium wilfordii TaxID=458696 RepID=UPI0018F8329A|nr:uncharacterized protein LOC119991964 [Tripterygium wilfordii]